MGRLPFGDLYEFSSQEVQQLLHNKFVVILGDSVQRTIYKDLVYFLQSDRLPTVEELIEKNPIGLNDHLVEGGEKHNRTTYKEVRQYRTDHHLVRVYFLTRVYTNYIESILEDFKAGPMPDLLILNSCLWDLNRYCRNAKGPHLQVAFREYRKNLRTLFQKLDIVLPTSCLVIWNTTMPIGPVVTRAYLKRGMKNLATHVDILNANFEGAAMACCYHFDVLDFNFCFRFLQNHRALDGVHWDNRVHRYMTKLLLTHTARSWGVTLQKGYPQNGISWNRKANTYLWARYQPNPSFHDNTIPNSGSFSGFIDFREGWECQACPEDFYTTPHGRPSQGILHSNNHWLDGNGPVEMKGGGEQMNLEGAVGDLEY